MTVKSRQLGPRRWNRMVNRLCKQNLGISLKQYRRLCDLKAFDWDGPAHCDLMPIEMLDIQRPESA